MTTETVPRALLMTLAENRQRRTAPPAVVEWQGGALFHRIDGPPAVTRMTMVNVLDGQAAILFAGDGAGERLGPGLYLREPPADGVAHQPPRPGPWLLFVSTAPAAGLRWQAPAAGHGDQEQRGQWRGQVALRVADIDRFAAAVSADTTLPASGEGLAQRLIADCLGEHGTDGDTAAGRIESALGALGIRVDRLVVAYHANPPLAAAAPVGGDIDSGPAADTGGAAPWSSPGRAEPERPQLDVGAEPDPDAARYYVGRDGHRSGPYTLAELRNQADAGRIDGATLVWKPGLTEWVSADQIDELGFLAGDQS